MVNIYALYRGEEILAVGKSSVIMERFRIKPSHFWSMNNIRARREVEKNPKSKRMYVVKVEGGEMKNSLNRRVVKRHIVEKPTEIYDEDIKPKVVKMKPVPIRERNLKGYAGYCFNLHYGAWKS